jgi:hypothetical protein
MPKITVLGKRASNGRMLIAGVFTQKKILWEVMQKLAESEDFTGYSLFDDMTGKSYNPVYNQLCERLRINGRVSMELGDSVVFQVIETEMNEVRKPDYDAEGNLVCNPAS